VWCWAKRHLWNSIDRGHPRDGKFIARHFNEEWGVIANAPVTLILMAVALSAFFYYWHTHGFDHALAAGMPSRMKRLNRSSMQPSLKLRI
jgi:hypothetical protein